MGDLHGVVERPRCWNRKPYAGTWAPNGPGRMRWIEHRMSDRCAAWDSGPSPISESVPARAGWKCAGCRWLPAAAAARLRVQRLIVLSPAAMLGDGSWARIGLRFTRCNGPGEFKHELRDIAGPVHRAERFDAWR